MSSSSAPLLNTVSDVRIGECYIFTRSFPKQIHAFFPTVELNFQIDQKLWLYEKLDKAHGVKIDVTKLAIKGVLFLIKKSFYRNKIHQRLLLYATVGC